MNDHDEQCEKAWRVVHGELASDERARLLRSLKDDPAMDRQLRQVRQMDRLLRALLPIAARPEADLEADILQAWEREHARETGRAGVSSWTEQLWDWLGSWQPAMAVAAVVLLILGASGALYYTLRMPQDVVWERVTWLPPEGRGAETSPEATADPALESTFCETIGAALKQASRGEPRGRRISEAWTLSAALTPTDGQALQVRVRAAPHQAGLGPLSWMTVLPATGDVQDTARQLAATMERDMRAALDAAPPAGRE